MSAFLNKRRAALVAFLMFCVGTTSGLAQSVAPREANRVRMYVFDCGFLNRGDLNPARYGLTLDQVETTDFADPCYLIVHPEGSLLWEAGIFPDRLLQSGITEVPRGTEYPLDSNRAERTLESQLDEIGYRPSDVTYLAVSHHHADHTANMNAYAGSTWLVQATGRAAMFSGEARESAIFENYDAVENSTTLILNGDHDVFGDGTVLIKSTPGHTEGHQSLFVRLENTGPLFLSGDLYHFSGERTFDTYPNFEVNLEQTVESRASTEEFLESTGADLWIQHDLTLYRSMRKSPAYYD